MTRTNDLQAAYDAADRRVHDARETLKGAIRERAQANAALAQSRVPVDLQAHLERIRQAGELTAEEQAARDEAQAAYDAAFAAESPAQATLARLLLGLDPKDGSRPVERMGPKDSTDRAREDRIKAAKQVAEHDLGYATEVTAAARRELNALIHRQDQSRQERRQAVKRARAAELEEQRRLNKPRRFPSFEFVRKIAA